MAAENRKRSALEFLRAARAGDRAAAESLFTPDARHHNAYFAAGLGVLLDAIMEAVKDGPARPVDVKHVIAEGDIVAVHSHVRKSPSDTGYAVMHIFRFEGDRIAELWDFGQEVPKEPVNADGMF